MKNLLFILILPLLTLTACNKDNDSKDNNPLVGTKWSQTIGDKTYWFEFYSESECDYTETTNGDNPYNYLKSVYRYSIDKNNAIIIYKEMNQLDQAVWLSGHLNNTGMSLTGETEIFELKKQ
ncbi:hypothetical protein [uncultured Bacteroides sp.]|uniref:hypothetical protein n=1 Tax=uncultured Bacteroides sp. TaxID=162156 RepID=UPI002AA6E7A0|nr:hypothetical protein [uncultured Bacteroides sp.]